MQPKMQSTLARPRPRSRSRPKPRPRPSETKAEVKAEAEVEAEVSVEAETESKADVEAKAKAEAETEAEVEAVAADDEVVEMSGRWSSRSAQSWSATGRRGPHVFSRRDTPRHVHLHKHDRGTTMHHVAYPRPFAIQAPPIKQCCDPSVCPSVCLSVPCPELNNRVLLLYNADRKLHCGSRTNW